MAQTEKGSEVKDFTADPIDSDKILGFKTSDGTRWFTLSRFMNWLKTKTASTVTSGDKTPVNSDAVNGALTEQGIYTTVSDLNELQAGQTCIFTVDTLNRPTTYGKCICYKANNWLFQKATTAAEEHPSEYIREKLTDGNWGSWQEVALKSDISNSIRVLEAGVIPPEQISANNHIHAEISLQHTYALANISFILTPVSYVNCAYITATGHWGYETQSSEGMTQSNGLTIYITNIYSTPQTCGCYYQIIGTDSDILI